MSSSLVPALAALCKDSNEKNTKSTITKSIRNRLEDTWLVLP